MFKGFIEDLGTCLCSFAYIRKSAMVCMGLSVCFLSR